MTTERNHNKKITWQDVVPAKPRALKPTKRRGKKLLFILIIATLLLIAVVGIIVIPRLVTSPNKTSMGSNSNGGQVSTPAANLVPGAPTYTILLPAGKTINDLGGGWVRDKSHPLFVYIDKIGTTKINVSEQPLPDDFKANAEQEVSTIAQSYNITQKLTVGGTVLHIGTFDKGLQRVILTKSNLLILITSTDRLTNDQWISYINSLS